MGFLSKFLFLRSKSFPSFKSVMDYTEALLIFDIKKTDSVYDKYKHLIKINHPDKGGSAYLTSKVNEAYKILKK